MERESVMLVQESQGGCVHLLRLTAQPRQIPSACLHVRNCPHGILLSVVCLNNQKQNILVCYFVFQMYI